MGWRLWQRGISLVAALAVAAVAACAPKMQPIGESERRHLTPMAVAVARFQPDVLMDDLNLGEAEGFASGALVGAGRGLGVTTGMLGSGSCSGSVCGAAVLVYLAIAATATVVGAAVGGAQGAAAAVPAEPGQVAVDEAVSAIRQGAVQTMLRDAVIEAAQRLGQEKLAVLANAGPSDREARPDYRAAGSEGLNSVLEIALLEIGLSGATSYDQRLAFYMRARARVLRLDTGAEVYSHELTTLGARRGILDWARSDARQLGEEIDRGYSRLAESIVEEVFLRWNPE